jgi:hypothetical protein
MRLMVPTTWAASDNLKWLLVPVRGKSVNRPIWAFGAARTTTVA